MRRERRLLIGYLACLLALGAALGWGIFNCDC